MLILRVFSKFVPKIPAHKLQEEQMILFDLASRFEDIHIRVPIISLYETVETRVKEGTFKTRKYIVSTLLLDMNTSHRGSAHMVVPI